MDEFNNMLYVIQIENARFLLQEMKIDGSRSVSVG